MNNYWQPTRKPGGSKRVWESNRNICIPINQSIHCLERNGPIRENLKVLHWDGSLADLPDQNVEGGGALEGTVGLGT
jgi:hypothetical protein